VTRTEDELRPVTVLFADVVGSTSLAERLQPEEVKALIGEFVSQMSRAVREYGGLVQAYMGDGICAYFGVPAAREDDPERAARAGLRILEVVREYARDVEQAWGVERFDVRIGLDTGPAALGTVGTDDPQAMAFGDTMNVAARLQSLASPGTIVVGASAARRLQNRFAFESLGPVSLRGRSEDVHAERLVGPLREPEDRPPRPLVGRDGEVEVLQGALDDLHTGRGQALLLVGEAGIGKTRLLEELRSLAGAEVEWLQGHCLSYGGPTTWPFEEMLRRWLGILEGEPEIALRTKARARLGSLLGDGLDDALRPLGRLLRIRLDPGVDAAPPASPEDLAAWIRRAYCDWVAALASKRPVVLAVEDLQWASVETRELAEAILDLTDRRAVLVVATFRSERTSEAQHFRLKAVGDFEHRTSELRLGPLDDEAAADLLDSLAPGIADDLKATLVARAEGNPLFLEELVRLLEEGELIARRRTWTLTVGAPTLPARLENLLVARIDALPGGASRLAQAAAVIGRSFEARLLERVAAADETAGDFLELVRAGIVREVSRYPELEYEFAHGLLHEAALSTLTSARQRELAGRVGDALEELVGVRASDDAERLAQYYIRSNRLDKAVAYLELAADAALAAGTSAHAADLLRIGQRAAESIGDGQAGRRFEVALAELEADPPATQS
jgi:class 3 adenylate cyclase